MTNEDEFGTASVSVLDAIGGENLVGSGFEGDIPAPEFSPAEHTAEIGER